MALLRLPDTLVSNQRSVEYAYGLDFDAAARTAFTGGHFKFTWIPEAASGTFSGTHYLVQFGTTAGEGIYLTSGTTLNVDPATGTSVTQALTWAAGDKITIEVDTAAGVTRISGALTGNGEYSHGGAITWNSALTSITVGGLQGGGNETNGTFYGFLKALLPDLTVTGAGSVTTYTIGTDLTAAEAAVLESGNWNFFFAPDVATYTTGYHTLVHFGTYYSTTDGDGVYFSGAGGEDPAALLLDSPSGSGTRIDSASLSWSADQEIGIEVGLRTGHLTISGATTGNGTTGDGSAHSMPTSITTITVGALSDGNSRAQGAYRSFFEVYEPAAPNFLLLDTEIASAGVTYYYGLNFGDLERNAFTGDHFRFTWIPAAASGTFTGTHVLVHFGTTGGEGIYLTSGTTLNVDPKSGSTVSQALTWNAGDHIRIEVNLSTGTTRISGALTGNGEYSHGGAITWNSALTSITVGDQVTGGLLTAGVFYGFQAPLLPDYDGTAGSQDLTVGSDVPRMNYILMRDSIWEFTVAHSGSSATWDAENTAHCYIDFDDLALSIWHTATPVYQISGTFGSSQVVSGMVWSDGQEITFTIDNVNGQHSVAGATAGDGTYTLALNAFPDDATTITEAGYDPAQPQSDAPGTYRSVFEVYTYSTPTAYLQGDVASVATVAGTLTAGADLAGAVSAPTTVAGTLTAGAGLQGAVDAAAVLAGTLTAGADLVGGVSSSADVSGSLTAGADLVGDVPSAASVAGALTAGADLVGGVTSAAAVAGALTTGAPLQGDVPSVAVLAGTLTAGADLVGDVASVATVEGSLTTGTATAAYLQGNVDAAAVLAGALTTGADLVGDVAAPSAVSGALTAGAALVGNVDAAAVLAGALTAPQGLLQGDIAAGSVVAGALTIGVDLVGDAASVASVTGALTTGTISGLLASGQPPYPGLYAGSVVASGSED